MTCCFHALGGFTNKEVSDILHIHANAINKKYSQFHDYTNVENKNELVELYKTTTNISILNKK